MFYLYRAVLVDFYMLKKLFYTIILLLVLLLTACDAWIYEYPEAPAGAGSSEPLVYLSIAKVAHVGGLESINKDAVDFEDRVHDMALFIFDSNVDTLVATYFDKNIPLDNKISRFTLAMIPGVRDFYFIANMNMSALEALKTKTEVVDYLNQTRNLDGDLYLGAADDKGFPMSRIYLNQNITKGGNALMPDPFRPVVNGSPEDKVKLERVTSKLEVKFTGSANIGVKKVYFKNANRQYSLVSKETIPSTFYTTVEEMKKSGDSYLYYMPEAWMNAADWEDTNHKPINYFLIETLSGEHYEIPIITHNGSISANQYLTFATGQKSEKPDYNIYRNRHYVYTINNLQQIEINYTIDPWQKVNFTTFMGYGFNIKVDDKGAVTIENTVDACDPHEIELKTKGAFKFDDDSTSQVFDDADTETSVSYSLTPAPQELDGDYLEVYYNGVWVKTFTK